MSSSHEHPTTSAVFDAGSTLLANQEPTEDPTGTKTAREIETGHYNTRWATVRGILRDTIEHNDALRLRDIDYGPEFSPPPGLLGPDAVEDFGTESNSKRLSRFSKWFREVIDRHLVEPLDEEDVEEGRHYSSTAIRRAYARGLALANTDLRRSDLPDPDTGAEGTENPSDLISRDRHQEALGTLFLGTYNDIQRAGNEAHTKTTRKFAKGLAAVGGGALTIRDLADQLVGRVDAVGQTRTETTANTRIVQAVNDAVVQRGAEAGVEQAGAHIEYSVTGPHEGLPEGVEPEDVEPEDGPRESWETAGDDRVCPLCEVLEGSIFRVSDILAGRTPQIPKHPRCRCLWILIT